MSDLYIRKLRPNAKHLIAFLLILLSAILFINGFHRACRISGRLTMMGLTFEPEVYEGDSILLSSCPIKAKLKGDENKTAIVKKTLSKNIIEKYDVFIDCIAGYYRPVMVKKGTDEYDKYLNGEEVSGYFTYDNFDDFSELMSDMGSYYELEKDIPDAMFDWQRAITDDNYSKLGIVIVDRTKEILSFLCGIPFLIIGIILLKISGTPFEYTKIADDEE